MRTSITVVILALSLVVGGCAKRQTPVATPQPAPPAAQPPQIATANPAPPRRVDEALPVPAQPAVSERRNRPFLPREQGWRRCAAVATHARIDTQFRGCRNCAFAQCAGHRMRL